MSTFLKLAAVLTPFVLFGCGGSLPACSDAEVIKMLKQIAANNGDTLVKVSVVSTADKSDKSCKCVALGSFRSTRGEWETKLNYDINMSDTGDEFMVTLLYDH